ncbi:unnamed protein product, partial [Rotaria sp. Silwood1]
APNFLPTSHLQQTIVGEIIKKPTYFRGSKDDVHDWLEKLEQRFKMAKWNDEEKLQYISIHLQDDAYRWWTQTSTTIKSWSLFTEAVTKAFGSTKVQELAFEQLKWYKQTVNQSITQYYDKIIELCKKVDPAMPDSLKLKYLMAGVKESLKLHIALYDPQTIETFLSYARKVEDTLSFTKTNYIIHQYNESQDVHTFQQSLSPIATPEGQHEHNEYKNVQYPQQELLDTKGENNSRYKNSFYSSPSRNSTPNKSSRICYTCDGVASCNISANPSFNNSSLFLITTLINDKYMKAMIDIDTPHTFISMKSLSKICSQEFINSIHRPVFSTHENIPFPIYGEIPLSIKMGEILTSIRAFIIQDLYVDCILGMDFIKKYKLHINSEEQTMSIADNNKRTTLHMNVNNGKIRLPVRLINTIRIKPKQTVSVPLSSYKALFRPSFNLQQHTPLVISSSLISVNDYTSFISLYNPKSYSQMLSKGIILGTTTISTLLLKNISTINKQSIYKNPNNSFHPNLKVMLGKINKIYSKRNRQPLDTASVAEKICGQVGSIFTCPKNKPTIYKRQPDQFDTNQLKIEQSKDPHIQQKIKELKQNPNEHPYVLQDGVLYKLMLMKANCLAKVKLIYLPTSMIDSFIKFYHTDPIADYSSIQRIYLKLKNKFWWPNMKQSIIQYINTCLHCQENSNSYIKNPDQAYPKSIISKQNSTQLVRNETTSLINRQHVNDIRPKFIKSK